MGELYKSVTELMKTARGNKALQGNLGDITDFQRIIDDTPIADVVEVVRCKDCDVPHNKWLGCPNLNGLIPPPDFYCARGKMKEK